MPELTLESLAARVAELERQVDELLGDSREHGDVPVVVAEGESATTGEKE